MPTYNEIAIVDAARFKVGTVLTKEDIDWICVDFEIYATPDVAYDDPGELLSEADVVEESFVAMRLTFGAETPGNRGGLEMEVNVVGIEQVLEDGKTLAKIASAEFAKWDEKAKTENWAGGERNTCQFITTWFYSSWMSYHHEYGYEAETDSGLLGKLDLEEMEFVRYE